MKKFLWPAIILLLYIIQAYDRVSTDDPNFYLFMSIIFYSAYRVFNDRHEYSLNMFFWIFNLVFLGYTASFQYMGHNFPWGKSIPNEIVTEVNIYILLAFLTYDLIYYTYNPSVKASPVFTISYPRFNYLYIGFGVFALAWLYTYATTGIHFTRYDLINQEGKPDISQEQGLLGGIFSRSIILFYCVMAVYMLTRKKINMFFGWMIIGSSILICFPTTVARNYAGIFYLGLTFNYLRTFRWKKVIPIVFIAVFVILFPLLTHARNDYFTLSYVFTNFSKLTSTAYISGDFDAYSMFCEAVHYVQVKDVTWGRQLAGSLLFFVPRSIWPDKPFGSGYFIGDQLGYSFLNISCPFMAEGYINFGLPGTLLFVGIVAFLFKKLDRFYWYRVKSGSLNNFWVILYPSLIGSFTFIMRGDLLSSYAYTVGLVASALVLHFIIRFRINKPGMNFSFRGRMVNS